MTHAQIIKQLKKHAAVIARERDKMRELLLEWDGVADSCDRAHDDLMNAIDALSEQV